jgi:hypothetical protein
MYDIIYGASEQMNTIPVTASLGRAHNDQAGPLEIQHPKKRLWVPPVLKVETETRSGHNHNNAENVGNGTFWGPS